MIEKKLKGGMFEQPIVALALIFIGMFVITLTIGFYFRSALLEEPIAVKTYTDYRWSNYFPSSVLFYLSYPSESWRALNEIVRLPYEKLQILDREEFTEKYKSEIDMGGYSGLDNLLDNLAEKTNKEKQTYFILDKKGLIISMGMPRDKLGDGKGSITVFPEEYPYNCFYKDMPFFSREFDNLRVRFVYCCGEIQSCQNYLTGPGRAECSGDPCGVGPCKMVVCAKGTNVSACKGVETGDRVCVLNEPPGVKISAKIGEGEWLSEINQEFLEATTVQFKIEIEKDTEISKITQLIIEFGGPEDTSDFEIFDLTEEQEKLEVEASDGGVIIYFEHEYIKKGEYLLKVSVVDQERNYGRAEISLSWG